MKTLGWSWILNYVQPSIYQVGLNDSLFNIVKSKPQQHN